MPSLFTAPIDFVRGAAAHCGLARFRRDQNGSTVVEFALVAAPFFALLFAIIETAILFFAGQALDSAVQSTARLIRTGQAQQQNMSADNFKTSICNLAGGLLDCSKLKVDVQQYTDFGDVNLGVPVDKNGNLNVTQNYNTGHGGNIVVVRAYYEWPVLINLLGNNLADLPDGSHLLVATAAFRNEPFPW